MSSLPSQHATVELTSKLALFESGYFADAEVSCGDKTWKVHRSELCVKSDFFRAAFAGEFLEATTAKIEIEEQNPEVVEIVLRHIYGADTDITTLTAGKPFLTFCVGVARAANYFLVHDLEKTTKTTIGHHLDIQLKELCRMTVGRSRSNAARDAMVSDLATAIADIVEWHGDELINVFVEFVWAARLAFLTGKLAEMNSLLKEKPEFGMKILEICGTQRWLISPAWAPPYKSNHGPRASTTCLACKEEEAPGCDGQIFDPFRMGHNNRPTAGWCRSCSDKDTIPWRKQVEPHGDGPHLT